MTRPTTIMLIMHCLPVQHILYTPLVVNRMVLVNFLQKRNKEQCCLKRIIYSKGLEFYPFIHLFNQFVVVSHQLSALRISPKTPDLFILHNMFVFGSILTMNAC